jgi:hypothetical protein
MNKATTYHVAQQHGYKAARQVVAALSVVKSQSVVATSHSVRSCKSLCEYVRGLSSGIAQGMRQVKMIESK